MRSSLLLFSSLTLIAACSGGSSGGIYGPGYVDPNEPGNDRDTRGAPSDGATTVDPSTPAQVAEPDPCVPVSVSTIVARVRGLEAKLETYAGAPSNGTVTVSKNGQGKVTKIVYDPTGYASDYTDTVTYDAQGRIKSFDHDADGYKNDYEETFTYDANGRLKFFEHDADGYTNDFEESFTYDASGRVKSFRHDADGYAADVDESFTYDADGRVKHWKYDADGYANDAEISVTYSSSGHSLKTEGTRASGATLSVCK